MRHLRYFMVLAKELSFSRAAEKLFISQPPLSRQIKELEEEIGTRLFDRNNRSVSLTEAGKYYQIEIQKILDSLEVANGHARKIGQNVNGEFRIGYISSTLSRHITALVRYLSNEYPFINVKLYEATTARQIRALELEKLDLGILRGPTNSHRLKEQLWFQDSYSIVFSKKDFDLAKDLNFKKTAEAQFVFFSQQHSPHYHDTLVQICSKLGFVPNVSHETNNINSILQLVNEGFGVSILPTSVARNCNYQNVRYLELASLDLRSDVLLVSPKVQATSVTASAVRWLIENY